MSHTQELLIVTAERLFAERGIGSVSLRDIVIESGQRNKSAANYHFGNKAGLVEAILGFRMDAIDVRRRELLATKNREGRGEELRDLLEVLVCPFAEQLGAESGKSWYARFIAQVALFSGDDPFLATRREGMAATLERLNRHLAHIPVEFRAVRLWSMLGLAVQTFADQERRLSARVAVLPTPVLVAHLIDELEGIAKAPNSTNTEMQMRLGRDTP
jgi:AcrR family transcriptional regulator